MTLEPTEDQVAELAKRFEAETLVRVAGRAGLGYEDFVRILWPLVRDVVLEAAARECELPQAEDGWVPQIAMECARDIRAMKGKQG